MKKLEQKVSRLQQRKETLIAPPPSAHLTRDEQQAISREAERQRQSRRRVWLKMILSTYDFDMSDVAAVVGDMQRLTQLFDTKQVCACICMMGRSQKDASVR